MILEATKEQGEETPFQIETGTPYASSLYGSFTKWGVHYESNKQLRKGGIKIEALVLPRSEPLEDLPLPGMSLHLSVEEALALYESLGARLEEVKEHYRNFPNGISSRK